MSCFIILFILLIIVAGILLNSKNNLPSKYKGIVSNIEEKSLYNDSHDRVLGTYGFVKFNSDLDNDTLFNFYIDIIKSSKLDFFLLLNEDNLEYGMIIVPSTGLVTYGKFNKKLQLENKILTDVLKSTVTKVNPVTKIVLI